jgi:sensor histidine kinase YesM
VEDDGVGMPPAHTVTTGDGIGVSNVRERLQVLYNNDYKMAIESQPGAGTRILIEIPIQSPAQNQRAS